MSQVSRVSIGARRNPETETAVLDAAAAIIREEGFGKLTMEAVARRARAGKATVYRWWPGRAYLLLALYSRAKSTLTEPDTGDMEQDLSLYLQQMLAQLTGSEGREPLAPMLRLLIAEAQMDNSIREALQKERDERWLHIDNILRRGQERGQLTRVLTPRQAEDRIIAMIWYLLLNDALPHPDKAAELVTAMMVDLRAG